MLILKPKSICYVGTEMGWSAELTIAEVDYSGYSPEE